MWEIFVPTVFEDTKKPVRTKHHKQWDAYVRKATDGLTILKPAKGQWVSEGKLYEDRVIPVRIACTPKDIYDIAKFTKTHYRQLLVMYHKVSDFVVMI